MNITQEVITDLLPVYFSGEASSDTHALVDSFFREHPDFEKLARRSVKVQLPVAPAPATNGEKEVLRRVRQKIRRRGTLLGLAISLTFAPLTTAISFGDQGTHLKWFMPRDYPKGALILGAVALVLWIAYFAKRGLKQAMK